MTSPLLIAPRSTCRSPTDDTVAEPKVNHQEFSGQGAFLLKTTEVSVESAPAQSFNDDQNSDRASTCSSAKENDKRKWKPLEKFNNRQSAESSNAWRSSEDLTQQIETMPFGTTVSIEAAQPIKYREQQLHEMKGLQQAASMKRWACEGKPAQAWGKLIKDPELWDSTGDTLVYFGYQRPHASFRIKASLLQDTKSEMLASKLQEGFQRTAKISSTHENTSALRGTKGSRLAATGRRPMTAVSENGTLVMESPIRHEIHFAAPDTCSRLEVLRHHITTRNIFAFLLSKPLVGLTYYQALTDLHQRLLLYMPPEVNCAQILIQYLRINQLFNVSNDPEAAAGLLAWTENHDVRWQEGWQEAFVHCVGMYPRFRNSVEIQDVGSLSRSLLERSYLDFQARIEEYEYRLSTFNFDDMWLTLPSHLPLCRRAFDHFRRFLQQYYERACKVWPADGKGNHWATRELVERLRKDFNCLYEYLVDRNRPWDKKDEKHPGDNSFLTTLLSSFDKKYRYSHIPYPYPLLPGSAFEIFEGKQPKSSLFSSKARTKEKQIIHAYAGASNSPSLHASMSSNGLVEAFIRFERTDLISELNPQGVRNGRWILLYGILQVLSILSVEPPGIKYRKAPYFLDARFSDRPPWQSDGEKTLESAVQIFGDNSTMLSNKRA